MNTTFYLPVLKSKQGEFEALANLSDDAKNFIVPLLEITPIEWDPSTKEKPRTMETHLQNFCKKLLKKWPHNNTFIDTGYINKKMVGETTCIEFVMNILSRFKIVPVPVIHIAAPERFLEAIGMFDVLYGVKEIGVRVSITDITSPDFEDELEKTLAITDYGPEEGHLILDLNSADFTNYEDFADGIIQALSTFPYLQKWKSFSIGGGSFPATNLIKTGLNLIPRNEWKFYKSLMEKLSKESFNRKINFSDYSMVSPGYFEYDPTKMSRSANIRYTHDDGWYVLKGKALKKSEDYLQYVQQAKEILNSAFYFGENFSDGDAHIKKCAHGLTSTGNPTVWSRVGNNHHFTKVIEDLSASYFAA